MTKRKTTKRALLLSALTLLMCVSMLVGSTFAWFTDSVTSAGNIIKSGSLQIAFEWADGDEALDAANWQDASQTAIFNYDKWEPGYVQARHLRISNIGTLALRYQMQILPNGVVSELADVIDVYYFEEAVQTSRTSFTDANKVGTLADIINGGMANAMAKTVKGTLLAEAGKDVDIVTIALKMREDAGNEYQNLSIGSDFSVRLIATQLAHEADSFDANYDTSANFPAQEIPTAVVKKIPEKTLETVVIDGFNGVKLDTGYQFLPSEEYEDIAGTKYENWHADYVVYADHKVPANSMVLAGYYKLFDDFMHLNGAWIGLTSDTDIPANQPIRLLQDGLGRSVNYTEICTLGNDGIGFLCGAADVNGKNAGTTLTVELRIYETEAPSAANGNSTNVETGNYIVIGTFEYMFDGQYDDAIQVANIAELQAALDNATGNTSIKFTDNMAGTVVINQPGNADSRILIDGNGYKFDGQMKIKGGSDNTAQDDSLVIRNVNFETATNACEFIWSADSSNGSFWRYAHNVTIENCTFTASGAAVHSAIGIKLQQAYDFNVKNCTATNMRTLLQAESCGATISVSDCKIINGKNGISLNNTRNAIVKNTEIEALGSGSYGIRHKGEVKDYSLTVENCKVKAFVPVLLRNVTGPNYTATFNGTNTLTATNAFGYQVVVSGGDWDNDAAKPAAPTGTYTLTGADSFNVFKGQ